MKTTSKIFATTLAFFCLFSYSASADFSQPKNIESEFGALYVPDGFDTNDNVQIVGEGLFPNLCFRPGTVKTSIDHTKKIVTLTPLAFQYSGPCLQVLLPWDRVIDLGVLHAGDYMIVQKNQSTDNRLLGLLKIPAAKTQSADDYLYAPISQAYYEFKEGKHTLKLSGEFSNDCTKLTNISIKPQTKVIVIQPISEMDTNAACKTGKHLFEKTVELPKLEAGRYLIHVRSLNGKSVNNLIDVE